MQRLPSAASAELCAVQFSDPVAASELHDPVSMSVVAAFLFGYTEPMPVFTIIIILPAPPFPSIVAVASLVGFVPPAFLGTVWGVFDG